MNLRVPTFLLFGLIVIASGCGDGRPGLVPATGQVTLNGEPVEGATVGFEPQDIEGFGRPSFATTDAQGNFSVGTYKPGDGMPKGKFLVTVKKTELVGDVPEDINTEDLSNNAKPIKMKWIVPERYGYTSESGLSVEVTSAGLEPKVLALEGDAQVQRVGAGAGNEP